MAIERAETPPMRHLRLWLAALDRTLAAAVERQAGLARDLALRVLSPHAITPDHASALAEQGARFSRNGYASLPTIALDTRERALEAELLTTVSDNPPLPLERLCDEVGLEPFERAALLLVAAAELSPTHERLYAYLVDDLGRAHASVELILLLTSGEALSDAERRRLLGPGGRLRRLGWLTASEGTSTAKTVLRLSEGVLDWLCGAQLTPPKRFADPDQVNHPERGPLPLGAETELACALLAAGTGVVAISGDGDRAAMAEALAAVCQRPLRRVPLSERAGPLEVAVNVGLNLAAQTDSIAWFDLDEVSGPDRSQRSEVLSAVLAERRQPIVVCGREPFRPPSLLREGRFAELTSTPSDSASATRDLAARIGVDAAQAASLFGRFRFSAEQRRTVEALAKQRSAQGPAGIERAARLATALAPSGQAVLVEPRRGRNDLVLPDALHRQVLEIAEFFVLAPSVDERWGFGHLSGAPGALKALFTGDPGTGKTLAAEVVAHELGCPLLKVDLAQVVSKWVGETEKNLQTVFDTAESAAAVLFFDEADTLFGKRGEVRQGTDRYANLEVGYLLQRIETYRGLVILASNLRDEIDPAFVRRFQILLTFPRPREPERHRLWQLAFEHEQGMPADLDWTELVRLDLTGAGIVGSARLAALLAAAEGLARPTMSHVREAITRQFRQESRLVRNAGVTSVPASRVPNVNGGRA